MRIAPAGLKALTTERDVVHEGSRLLETYLSYLERAGHMFEVAREQLAAEMIGDVACSVAEAHALLMHPKARAHPHYDLSGGFLVPLYARTPQHTIAYDLDTPKITCLGKRTKEIFVNNGRTGNWLGEYSSGVIINNGTTGSDWGYMAQGVVINAGKAGARFASGGEGIMLVLREGTMLHFSNESTNSWLSKVLRQPGFQEYVEKLVAVSREEPAAIEKEFGTADIIVREIRELERSRWYHFINSVKEALR